MENFRNMRLLIFAFIDRKGNLNNEESIASIHSTQNKLTERGGNLSSTQRIKIISSITLDNSKKNIISVFLASLQWG